MVHLNLAITGLIFSIIFTSAEIALLCANSLQISVWNKQKNTFSKFAVYILNNKEEFLTVILIGTNLANIGQVHEVDGAAGNFAVANDDFFVFTAAATPGDRATCMTDGNRWYVQAYVKDLNDSDFSANASTIA